MRTRFLFLAICVLAGGIAVSPAIGAQQPPTIIQTLPATPEMVTMYRAFLTKWDDGAPALLNIAETTEAFTPDEDDQKGCLKDFSRIHTATTHSLPADAFAGLKVKLINPRLHEKRDPGDAIRKGVPVDQAVNEGFAAAIFTFSEIVFNADHTRAAFSYSFVCGGLCGNGGTVIFKLGVNGKWVQQKAQCSSWIS